jgi:hypothetical protein
MASSFPGAREIEVEETFGLACLTISTNHGPVRISLSKEVADKLCDDLAAVTYDRWLLGVPVGKPTA